MQQEKQTPGPGRGFVNLGVGIDWIGAGIANAQSSVGALDDTADSANWTQETNSSYRYQPLPQPYLAPAGATAAILTLRLSTNAADRLPTVFLDDVELVDLTANP